MAWFDEFNLPGATIDGYFGFILADGPDDDEYPDVVLANGTVTFTATTEAGRVDGAWLGIQPVTAQIFEGKIVISEEDPRPVRLLATDAPIGVADWAWRASFNVPGFRLNELTFRAPRDTTVNLTAGLIPIKSQPYQIIEGASIVDAEVSGEGEMRFELSDGTFTRWMDVPNGERGLPGEKGDPGPRGADGASATLAMGSVTAGSTADAWMTGTPLARELNLVLPRGQKGEKGDPGSKGDPGDPATPITASVAVTTGAAPGGTATVSGGNLHLALTIPPMGDGAILGTQSLDSITASGLYRQIANGEATIARGYPVAGVGGTLWVELRSNSLASQWWTPQGIAPYSQYFRRGGPNGWTPWEGIPTTKNRSGPEIGTTPLDQILETGVYRQVAAAQATLARGYPVAGMSGTLRVEERSNGLVSQVYTPHDYAPFSMYWRRGTTGSWTDWEGIETTSSRQGPFLGDTHLDTLTKTGTHRQAYPNFIPGNGYPPGAGVGVLQVFHRSEGMALQVYWTVGAAMEAQGHYRVSTPTGWTDWRAFSGGGSGGGVDEADLLAGYEAAKGNL